MENATNGHSSPAYLFAYHRPTSRRRLPIDYDRIRFDFAEGPFRSSVERLYAQPGLILQQIFNWFARVEVHRHTPGMRRAPTESNERESAFENARAT